MEANELINFIKSLGVEVNTTTKARGYQGFYMKNRIDVSKNVSKDRFVPTLIHEFAHYVHSQIEPFVEKTGGTLEVLFDDKNISVYQDELYAVTNIVDKNSKCEKLKAHKNIIKNKIQSYEDKIKSTYPNFMRSKAFKEFDKYIKRSDARYLLKYDRVKLLKGFLFKKYVVISVDNIEKDFEDMPIEFASYIRLKSCQKRQARVSARINKAQKYYSRPTELFARFVEGLYICPDEVKHTAPNTYKRFFELLQSGYYKQDLARVIDKFYIPVNL